MTDLTPILDHARAYFGTNMPQVASRVVPASIALLGGGVALSVLGAKFAKPGIALAGALVGGYLGSSLGSETGYHPALCAAAGAGMFATITFLTFRMWVGAMTALVFSTLALGAFGYMRVAPHVAEFDASAQQQFVSSSAEQGGTDSAALLAGRLDAYRSRPPQEWAGQFWSFVQQRDGTIDRSAKMLGFGAMMAGLFLGVIAMRTMLILSTSVLGTACVVSGVLALLAQIMPGSYQTVQHSPTVMGMGVGGFLVTSVILQALLTRKASSEKESASKSK